MQIKLTSKTLLFGLLFAGVAMAAVSPEEAARLGQELTPMGAEKAGNADGTIPAWSGEMITPPASFTPGDGKRPIPWPETAARHPAAWPARRRCPAAAGHDVLRWPGRT